MENDKLQKKQNKKKGKLR